MSDNFTAGVLAGIVGAFLVYPVALVIGAASIPFHRHSKSRSATAGVLFAFRWTVYLTVVSAALLAWGIGMLVETTTVGTLTAVGILLTLAYAYVRR